MASVTQRVKQVKQPYGGYLPLKMFVKEIIDDGQQLAEAENIHASLVGMSVDYLTRFLMGTSVDNAFLISSMGALIIEMQQKAEQLKSNITGLDDDSITAACKLAGFDVCLRASPLSYVPIENINPDAATIANIRIMVQRSVKFFEKYGPILYDSPTFSGGYSETVDSGDSDFVTSDTLWDFKVTRSSPTSKHSLQILMYYIMGTHSVHDYFKNLKYLGFYNPRLNIVYRCPINSITADVISEVENTVIAYGHSHPVPIAFSAPAAQEITNTTKTAKITTSMEGYVTISDLCNLTGVSRKAIYSEIHKGRLSAVKKGNKYFISRIALSNYREMVKHERITKICIIVAIIVIVLLFFFTR